MCRLDAPEAQKRVNNKSKKIAYSDSYTPRIESHPTSGSMGDIHEGSSFAVPANCRCAPPKHEAAEALGAAAAVATRNATARLNCLSITHRCNGARRAKLLNCGGEGRELQRMGWGCASLNRARMFHQDVAALGVHR
jgi:hypothetical protein